MLTVFLSSTSKDLELCREAAYRAIEGLDDVHCDRMEDFGAIPSAPDDFCRAKVAKCDLVACVVGPLYGSRSPSGLSYTEREFDAAILAKKPCLVFMTPDDYAIAANLIEADDTRNRQLQFRKKVSDGRGITHFSTPHHLSVQVVQAIRNWEHAQPKDRYIRDQFKELVAELNRQSNLPYDVQLDRAAAKAALAEQDFESARRHLSSAAQSTRRAAEHAVEEYARSLAALGALAFTERDYGNVRKYYGSAMALPALQEERLARYRRSYLIASNAVISGAGTSEEGRKVLTEMIAAGVKPDEISYNTLINLAKDYAEGRNVLAEMIAAGVKPDEVTYNTLINLAGDYAEGRNVLAEMIAAGVKPNEVTYSTLINLAKDYAEGRNVLAEMIAAGVKPNEVTYNTLINLAEDYAEGRNVLAEMIAAGAKPDEVTYNTLINLAEDYAEGRNVLAEMTAAGVKPDEITMVTLVTKAQSFEQGCELAREAKDGRDWYTGRGFYSALFSLPILHLESTDLINVYKSLPFHFETALENPIRQYRRDRRHEEAMTLCLSAPHIPAAQKLYREKYGLCRKYLESLLLDLPPDNVSNYHYCFGIAAHTNCDWQHAKQHLAEARKLAYASARIEHIDRLLSSIP